MPSLSGTTLVSYGPSSGSSSNSNSRGANPERSSYCQRITFTTEITSVPLEQNPKVYVETVHRVNRQGKTVIVHNHGARADGR